MNYGFMVNNSISPSTQKSGCDCKKSDVSDAFADALAEMMQEGNTQISVNQVSVTGKTMSDEGLILPSNESLKELCSRLDYMLDLFFVRNGISKNPPVEVEYSYTRTEVKITGDREDIEKLNELINQDSDIKQLIQKTIAIASHVVNMAESLSFQAEYRTSSDPESVLDKYAYLFDDNRQMHNVSLSYGDGLDILSDGKTYSM